MTGRGYDFWLLDLDGTVVDVHESYVHEVIEACADRIGAAFTDREAELVWYGGGGGRDRVFEEHGVDSEAFWEVFHEIDRPGRRADASYVYDDADAVVPELPGPVGVVTHCQEYLTGPILDELGIADWFDTVVCCTPETGWKPDPTPVEMAVTDLGTDGAGVLVGDDPRDVQAAHNAGLDGIHVARADHRHAGEAATDGGVAALEGVPQIRRLTELPG
jgi:phosphoglycolate phosphatase